MIALICCAGSPYLWGSKELRHMIEIQGETLIDRTIRQLKNRDITPIIVANDERIKASEKVTRFLPNSPRWFVETVLQTSFMWDDRVAVLHGDVWFSDAAMDAISSKKGLVFHGRRSGSRKTGGSGEIFGFTFDKNHFDLIKRALNAGLEHAISIDPDNKGHKSVIDITGSAWQPYRWIIGADLDQHIVDDKFWNEIDDFTDDFDKPGDLKRWLRNYRARFINGNSISNKGI